MHENYNYETMAKPSIMSKILSKSYNDLFDKNFINHFKSLKSPTSFSSSMVSMDTLFKLKTKRKYKSTVHISILTILSFWCQVPIRLFICWSYTNSFLFKFGINNYQNFLEDNYQTIIFYYNFFILVYFLNIVFNSVIYNIFSVQFRKALNIKRKKNKL